MARTAKDLETTLYGWPEQGGFQFDTLLELLAELDGRLEALEEENRRLRERNGELTEEYLRWATCSRREVDRLV